MSGRFIAQTIAVLALAAVPVAASAQAGSAGGARVGNQNGNANGGRNHVGASGSNGAPTAQAGTLEGIVTGLNLASGEVQLNSNNGLVTLRATPSQIAQLNQGDVASLPYAVYGGVPWVQQKSGTAQLQGFAKQGQIRGRVTGLNRARGLVAVNGAAFNAHPQNLVGIVPGQFVSLHYRDVGNAAWAQNIQPVANGNSGANNNSGSGNFESGGGLGNGGYGNTGAVGNMGGANVNPPAGEYWQGGAPNGVGGGFSSFGNGGANNLGAGAYGTYGGSNGLMPYGGTYNGPINNGAVNGVVGGNGYGAGRNGSGNSNPYGVGGQQLNGTNGGASNGGSSNGGSSNGGNNH